MYRLRVLCERPGYPDGCSVGCHPVSGWVLESVGVRTHFFLDESTRRPLRRLGVRRVRYDSTTCEVKEDYEGSTFL